MTQHTMEEDFQHFLSYSNLSGESADVLGKLRKAYEANWCAKAAQPIADVSAPTDERALKLLNDIALWWHADKLQVVAGDPAAFEELMEGAELFMLKAKSAPTVEKLMADMDTMRDEFHSLSRALSFWLPRVPVEAGPIQDRVVHDAYFLTDGPADDKCAEELGWITLNKTLPSAPLSNDALELLNSLHGKASIPIDWPQPFAGTIVLLETLAEIGMTAKRDGQPTANSRLCVRFAADLRDFLAARAAAPVSGQACKACNGAGTWIGQHDGYDDADCAACDGSGKAPVSVLGASIGDDKEFTLRLSGLLIAERQAYTPEGRRRITQLCKEFVQFIDSRLRSEDSRAEVLEEAAEACENLVESIGDAAAYDQREMYDTELERMHTAMACAAAIRTLATTAAQKEGNV